LEVTVVVVWIVLAVVLLLAELHHGAFYVLFAAVGSAAAAVVALFAPGLIWAQLLAAVVAAVLGILFVRPIVSRVAERRIGPGHVGPGVHGGLVGQEVVTLDDVGDSHNVGHVRLAGERWRAVSGDDRLIPAGTAVMVMAVQGTTLVVWPLHGRGIDSISSAEEV
jgi:membrane protein implicated in regulation of membrane protease activity